VYIYTADEIKLRPQTALAPTDKEAGTEGTVLTTA